LLPATVCNQQQFASQVSLALQLCATFIEECNKTAACISNTHGSIVSQES